MIICYQRLRCFCRSFQIAVILPEIYFMDTIIVSDYVLGLNRAGCLVFKLSSSVSFAFSTLRGRLCNACIVLIDLQFSQSMS